MMFSKGMLARLNISEALEGHYYEDGDTVRVLHAWEAGVTAYRVKVLRTNRELHFAVTDCNLEPYHHLYQLAECAE